MGGFFGNVHKGRLFHSRSGMPTLPLWARRYIFFEVKVSWYCPFFVSKQLVEVKGKSQATYMVRSSIVHKLYVFIA